jgi:predicted amidophosphoribosyltransferase
MFPRFLQYILDSIFPPSQDERLLRAHTIVSFKKFYCPHVVGTCTALATFSEPEVRAAVHANKFHNHHDAQTFLAVLLTTYIQQENLTHVHFVPIPLSPARVRTRTHNQVLSVLSRATLGPGCTIDHWLLKSKDTPSQTTLAREDRLKNVSGVFEVPAQYAKTVAGADIILIDDVITTGATLKAARQALLPYKPGSVRLVALAH